MPKKVKAFFFTNITNRQTFTKNAFWLAVGNIGGRLIRAAIIVYAARVLGAGAWGVFSYGITLVAFLAAFVDIGIDSILTRERAKSKENPLRQKEILSTSFFIKAALLAAAVIAVIFAAPRIGSLPEVKPLLPMMAIILVFDVLRNFGFSVIRSKEKMEFEAMLFIFTNVAIVAFGLVSLSFAPNVASFTLAYALGTGAGLIATSYALKDELAGVLSHFSKPLVKEILSSVWPFAISGVLGLLMLNTDVLIIGWFRSAEDVGLYSAAVRIVQLLYIFAGVAAQSSLPIFSRFHKEDSGRVKASLERILKFSFSFSLPVALGGAVAGPALVGFLFGDQYAGAGRSFQILLLTLAFNFVAVILSNVVFVYNKQKVLIIYMAIGGILNVAFDLFLIPKFGIEGSAVATLLSQIFADAYLWFIAWRIVRFSPRLKLHKILIASVAASVVLYFFTRNGVSIFLAGPIAAALYLGSLYLLKEPIFKEALAILKTG